MAGKTRRAQIEEMLKEDVEDDGAATFLKVRRGKGAKFRRVPVSRHLRRELLRYLNRQRPETAEPNLLVLRDGRPVRVETVTDLFRRVRRDTRAVAIDLPHTTAIDIGHQRFGRRAAVCRLSREAAALPGARSDPQR